MGDDVKLPGRCQVCSGDVVWNGKVWRDLTANGKHRHVCPEDRPTCNAVMRWAGERCARRPGHTTEHRTRYALDNALRMKTGRAA
jgi:hypothetical protein